MLKKIVKKPWQISAIFSVLAFVWGQHVDANELTAPVSGFARSFLFGLPISSATITVLETGQQLTTDSDGKFGPFLYPVGRPITLILESLIYKQSIQHSIQDEGLRDGRNNRRQNSKDDHQTNSRKVFSHHDRMR